MDVPGDFGTDRSKNSTINSSASSFYRETSGQNHVNRTSDSFHGKNYTNMVEYAKDLQPWLYQYRFWSAMNSFSSMMPYYLMHSFTPSVQPISSFQSNQPASQAGTVPTPNRQEEPRHHQQPAAERRIGTEYRIPSLWRRVAAELIDFIVLFYLKVMLTVMVLRHMGYLRDDNLLEVRLDIVPILDIAEMDLEKAFNVTSEIIALEIINRIMITIFETLCLRKGFGGTVGGATPGKRVFGMKVVSCEHVYEIRHGKILVVPAGDPGFFSALVRSVIKNFTMAFFFPACLTVFIFQHNRAAYDVLSKTIVVQSDEPRWR